MRVNCELVFWNVLSEVFWILRAGTFFPHFFVDHSGFVTPFGSNLSRKCWQLCITNWMIILGSSSRNRERKLCSHASKLSRNCIGKLWIERVCWMKNKVASSERSLIDFLTHWALFPLQDDFFSGMKFPDFLTYSYWPVSYTHLTLPTIYSV